jgi:hypothetical protein
MVFQQLSEWFGVLAGLCTRDMALYVGVALLALIALQWLCRVLGLAHTVAGGIRWLARPVFRVYRAAGAALAVGMDMVRYRLAALLRRLGRLVRRVVRRLYTTFVLEGINAALDVLGPLARLCFPLWDVGYGWAKRAATLTWGTDLAMCAFAAVAELVLAFVCAVRDVGIRMRRLPALINQAELAVVPLAPPAAPVEPVAPEPIDPVPADAPARRRRHG